MQLAVQTFTMIDSGRCMQLLWYLHQRARVPMQPGVATLLAVRWLCLQVPIYDFKQSKRVGYRTQQQPTSRVVIIEGIYSLSTRLRCAQRLLTPAAHSMQVSHLHSIILLIGIGVSVKSLAHSLPVSCVASFVDTLYVFTHWLGLLSYQQA